MGGKRSGSGWRHVRSRVMCKCDKCGKELSSDDKYVTHIPGYEWRQKLDAFNYCSTFNFCLKCANRRSAKCCVRELMSTMSENHSHEKHLLLWCKECEISKCRQCLAPISDGPGYCKDCRYENEHRWDFDDDIEEI